MTHKDGNNTIYYMEWIPYQGRNWRARVTRDAPVRARIRAVRNRAGTSTAHGATLRYHPRPVALESEDLAALYILAKRAGASSEHATAIARRPMTDDENELLEALERFAAKNGREPSVGGALVVLLQALDLAESPKTGVHRIVEFERDADDPGLPEEE